MLLRFQGLTQVIYHIGKRLGGNPFTQINAGVKKISPLQNPISLGFNEEIFFFLQHHLVHSTQLI